MKIHVDKDFYKNSRGKQLYKDLSKGKVTKHIVAQFLNKRRIVDFQSKDEQGRSIGFRNTFILTFYCTPDNIFNKKEAKVLMKLWKMKLGKLYEYKRRLDEELHTRKYYDIIEKKYKRTVYQAEIDRAVDKVWNGFRWAI